MEWLQGMGKQDQIGKRKEPYVHRTSVRQFLCVVELRHGTTIFA